MKKLIEQYCEDLGKAIETQNAKLITQHFAKDATYRFRLGSGWMDVEIKDMADSCLSYKDIKDKDFAGTTDSIDELADGRWVSVIVGSVNKKPYSTVSFFKFNGDKIVELVEYYGDFE